MNAIVKIKNSSIKKGAECKINNKRDIDMGLKSPEIQQSSYKN